MIRENLRLIVLLPLFLFLYGFSFYLLYLGFTTAPIALTVAQVFLGANTLLLALISFQLGNFTLKRFFAQHALFFIGIVLILNPYPAKAVLSSVSSFELGSFALIITSLFILKKDEIYKEILFYAVTGTSLFFLTGFFLATLEVLYSEPLPFRMEPIQIRALNSLFLLGVFDLLVLGLQFYSILYDRYIKHQAVT